MAKRRHSDDISCVGWVRSLTFGHRPQATESQPADHGNSICIAKGVNNYMFIDYFRSLLAQLIRNEEGQTAVEYGLVLALIAIVIVVAMATGLGGVVTTVLGKITTAL